MSASLLELTIDYREKELYNTFIKYGIQIKEPCNLDIGDIVINVPGASNKKVIIERKRFDDLAASIKDGRYDEQKMRCLAYLQQNPGSILIYILEGDLSYCRNNTDITMVLGSWISMELRDRIPVIRVLNMDECVKWISRLCERIKKKPEEFFKADLVESPSNNDSNTENKDVKTIYFGTSPSNQSELGGTVRSKILLHPNTTSKDSLLQDNLRLGGTDTSDTNVKQVTQSEYLNTIKTKKKENITPETCGQVMLSVIPGMSSETAKVILDTLGNGSLVGLINALAITGEQNADEKKKMLSTIQIKPGRKLGPALADKLWDYLFTIKK